MSHDLTDPANFSAPSSDPVALQEPATRRWLIVAAIVLAGLVGRIA